MTGSIAIRPVVAGAGLVAIAVAALGADIDGALALLAALLFVTAHLIAAFWDVRSGHWNQRVAAAALPTSFVLIAVLSPALLPASVSGTSLTIVLTVLIAQATLARERRHFMLGIGLTGLTLVLTAVFTSTAGLGVAFVCGWLSLLVAALVVNASPMTTPGLARLEGPTWWSTRSIVTFGAVTTVVAILLALTVAAVLPGQRSVLVVFSLDQLAQLSPPAGVHPDLPQNLDIPPLDQQPDLTPLPPQPEPASPGPGSSFAWFIVIALVVILVLALLRNLPDSLSRRRERRTQGTVPATAREGAEPLGAFHRLEAALVISGAPRAPAETPIELSLRLPGPPYGALVTVEQACYSQDVPSENERMNAAQRLDETSRQLAATSQQGRRRSGRRRDEVRER